MHEKYRQKMICRESVNVVGKRNVIATGSDGKEVERKQEQWQRQKKDYLLMPD